MLKTYLAAKVGGGWMTARDLASSARVSRRAASKHANDFSEAGIFEHVRTFPEHRYRLVERPELKNAGLVYQLERAREMFGEWAFPGKAA